MGGNAGTWSTETKDHLQSVTVLQPDQGNTITNLTPAACEFSYRTSIFKRTPAWVILRATFTLLPGDQALGEALVQKDLRLRREKQPYEFPSAGSFFKNPDKEHGIFSGQLIESSGLKGYRIGGAEVSLKHANFIVNRSHATSHDITTLMRHIQKTVQQKWGILLEPEVHIINQPSALPSKLR